MKKLSGLGLGLLCVLALTGCGSTDTSGLEKKLDKLEKNITSLNEKINDLEAVDVAAEEKEASEKEAQEIAKKKTEKETEMKKLFEGKIKVPDTARKTQEQVTAEFETVGLKAKFVATNMDNSAISGKRIVYKGECDYLNESCGAEYFDPSTVGFEYYGYYAKKGDTIIVGYSDHEIDGTSGSLSKSSSTTQSSSNETVNEKSTGTTSKSDIEAAIKKVDGKYDEMIKKAQGYVDNPSTYDDTAALSFLTDYTELMAEYASLGEAIDNSEEDLSATDSMTIYTNMLTKYSKLMDLFSKL